ncbi:hypothetical protein [Aeromicrobium chenweiae]|uniref:Uncharacterized protein n=1 Tax=Aeromicrobium chenweiae TaxID=2079793 RepID=A0A2S0WRF1_9ACTN|nr:hypothetical protein [Aeromicrobium chenweiae]AWB93919.1 hypothetical protein C3E78_17825 [Aeromicrobium chenweiae]TGN30964.1 hypothetical protein E4L97_15240 [Aeromicrobium chenweiae]
MWSVVIVVVVVALLLVCVQIVRRRARGRTPFAALSREDQVQALRHHQDGEGLRGARDSSSAPGMSRFDSLGPWGP